MTNEMRTNQINITPDEKFNQERPVDFYNEINRCLTLLDDIGEIWEIDGMTRNEAAGIKSHIDALQRDLENLTEKNQEP